jgi:3-oxoacyl-[acyl-carrier protein] reductase
MKNQVALVTGGASGIGKAICRVLATRGVHIVVGDVNFADASVTAEEISKMGVTATPVKCDVSIFKDVNNLFKTITETHGRLDILVNNAGIIRNAPLSEMEETDWDPVIDTNLKGVFLCSKEAVKIMVPRRYGRIINITSIVAFTGNREQANYAASKAGIIGITKTTAREYAKKGITVNAVAPGFILTPMTEYLPNSVKKKITAAIPLGRMGKPGEVADAVVFLASPEAGYITGSVIHVNGGLYMG